jgi:hypothetical protein
MSGAATNEAENLKKRACWYREFAKLSSPSEAIGRYALAEFFERKAQELEDRKSQPATGLTDPHKVRS